MEGKNIQFLGLTRMRTDAVSQDGELSDLVGMGLVDGELRRLDEPMPLEVGGAPFVLDTTTGERLVCVHDVVGGRHYIVTTEASGFGMLWYDGDGVSHTIDGTGSHTVGDVQDVVAVGNTLAVTSSSGMCYLLWKGDGYTYLGDSVPDVDLQFGLVGKSVMYHSLDWDRESSTAWREEEVTVSNWDGSYTFTADQRAEVTGQVLAIVNRYIRECVTKEGRFVFPFFVRYALRLYDGSLSNHSAPVLMMPGDRLPLKVIGVKAGDNSKVGAIDMYGFPCRLKYWILDAEQFSELHDDWSDIVKGIEVFVSAPIWTYDQNGEVTGIGDWSWSQRSDSEETPQMLSELEGGGDYYKMSREYASGDTDAMAALDGVLDGKAQWWSVDALVRFYHSTLDFYTNGIDSQDWYIHQRFNLPTRSEESVRDDISKTSIFYQVKSIDITGTETAGGYDIDLSGGELVGLLGREQMSDDYQTHERRTAAGLASYNNRLHLANVTRYLYDGYPIRTLFARQKDYGIVSWEGDGSYDTSQTGWQTEWLADIYMSYNSYDTYWLTGTNIGTRYELQDKGAGDGITLGRNDIVSATAFRMLRVRSIAGSRNIPISYWFYYPSPECKTGMISRYGSGSYTLMSFAMEEHPLLNGSYAYVSTDMMKAVSGSVQPSSGTMTLQNAVYVSEVNNPFLFKAENVLKVGEGTVLGLASNTQALSQGQFGQHPMYAFCSDGVWALSVSGTGGYAAVQPVCRDVCSDAGSITQLDGSVLFATRKGLMMLSGSDVKCVSEALDGTTVNMSDMIGDMTDDDEVGFAEFVTEFALADDDHTDFRDFLENSVIAFDYTGERVFVTKPGKDYSYVLMLRGGKWCKMDLPGMVCAVNCYPDTLMQGDDGKVYSLMLKPGNDYQDDSERACYALTRPLKLDDPTSRKSIQHLMIEQRRQENGAEYVLWGSDDLMTWRRLQSLRGRGYKYYRLGLFAGMMKGDGIGGVTVTYQRRMNWKLRR